MSRIINAIQGQEKDDAKLAITKVTLSSKTMIFEILERNGPGLIGFQNADGVVYTKKRS